MERKTNQSELKVPTWKARRKLAVRVEVTLGVKMRRKGSRWVYRRLVGFGGGGGGGGRETEVSLE